MKKFSVYFAAVLAAVAMISLSVSASAQTLSLNDGSILQSNTSRVGVNIGAIDYWDQGQILKNLIGSSDPGMEPLQDRQIWALTKAGTANTFTIPDIYDTVPANYWAGGTFTIVEVQAGGAELGCTGTISSNTGPNYPVASVTTWVDPVITVSSGCSAPFSVGDIIVMSKTTFPTPESWWETGGLGGTAGTVNGGGQLLSDTTDLCATCGTQALNMNATVAGSSARAAWGFDSESVDNVFVLMNGTYQLSFWAKSAAGTPTLTASVVRGSQGGVNCGSYTPKLTGAWTQYTWNCTASESAASLTPAAVLVSFNTTGGSVYLDNVSFEKISGNSSNTTVLRDEVIETLQKFYGPSIGNNPGTLRYWVNQNGETIGNWTQPDYAHMPTSSGTGYFVSPGGMGTETLSLQDYLVICQYLNAVPYLEIPVTLTTADAANLIEFLASPSTTTFGARRATLGQTQPWTSVFSTIHLSFCNECWNSQFAGQSLAARPSGPDLELYYDYSTRARDIFAAMRADSYYSQSAFDLVMNAQTAGSSTMDQAIERAHPDSIEIEDYTMGPISSFATDAELWGAAMVDPWEKVTNPKDIRNFYQSVHDYQSQTACGSTAKANCKVNIYEWGQGTISGGIDQTHLDYINAGAGEGVIMALQPLLNLQYYDIRPQSFFALTEYKNSALAPASTSKLWGNTVDMGGATNNLRPTFLGVQVVNQSIIGPMYSCPINGNLTYNFAGSPNGVNPMPAMTNVPYLYAFCFENGTKRSMVLINTDLTTSHTLKFDGTNPPFGSVTQRQYAPSDLDEMNEAPTGTATNLTQATSAIETSTLSSPTSITLPPFSVTALDYTAQGLAAAAMPTFSPAAGTYTTAQSVTINDTTAGTTIYYTTDGSTPTTSSKVYSAPITVSGAETVQAIAVASGYATSPAGSATYAIDPMLPTPTFSVAAGTYATTQSVSISEAQTGTTIYYTTNGTTPTTSSAKYSGPISVSATETLEAIAVETGYSTSSAATVTYTIAPALPAVTFSPAPGTYPNAMAVNLSESTAGAVIYYTTNGTTPTASSTQYGGPLWLNASETLNAIAVEKGFTNSPAVTGTFNISPVLPAPTFSPGTGIFTAVQPVIISDSTAGTTIYYTTNGATPTTSSAVYSGPVSVGVSETLKAIAVKAGFSNSPAGSATYTVNLANSSALPAPAFSPAGGTYATTQTVVIGDATAGTTIYYTTNGTTPTTSSAKYSGAITVSASEVLEAIAVKTGSTNSPVAAAAYAIGTAIAPPTFSPAGGTYSTSQTVTISDASAGTTIYYTTNGTTPTTSSAVYTGPITVSASETLEAIAVATGSSTATAAGHSSTATGANSAVATAAYTINPSSTTLPAVTFSPAPGTYKSAMAVTMSESTPGAVIYYTTNGTTPTTSSTQYGGALWLNASETLNAIAVVKGHTNSPVVTGTFTIAPVLPAPTFSPGTGIFTATQPVTISDSTAGTTIYYTTNGTTPTTSSTLYSGPISVSASETLQAIAVKTGFSNSVAGTATYTINSTLSPPTFSSPGGIYTAAQKVTISDSTAGATIYYTTNGTTPTTSSTPYTGPVTISTSETLQAIAVETGHVTSPVAAATYTIGSSALATPTFSLAGGTYTSSQTVSISDASSGVTIYYTTNGTAPSASSTKYASAITVSASETLEAIAIETGHTNSAVAVAAFTINPAVNAAATPIFSPAGGTYATPQTVVISDATAGATIYFTTNGITPTTSSAVYTGAVAVSASETLRAIAIKTGSSNSSVATAAYTIGQASSAVPAVAFSPAPGTYKSSMAVNISDAMAGTVIYYTTNGTTPTTASTQYGGPLWLNASETLNAIAVKKGYSNSPAVTAAYTIAPVLNTPTFSLATGIYTSTQTATISDAIAGSTIYYTTNGTTPTTSSTVYTGPMTVSASETVNAIAVKTGYTNSLVGMAAYTINSTLSPPTFSHPGGVYISAQAVAISEITAGATIYYTTNGTAPTTSSTKYSGAITVSASETLKALAVATGHVNSPVATAIYTISGSALSASKLVTASETRDAVVVETGRINSPVATAASTTRGPAVAAPTFSVAAGTYTGALTVTLRDANSEATIYYTTDGTTPTTSSTKYSGPIEVSATENVQAIAVQAGSANSPAAVAKYTVTTAKPAFTVFPNNAATASE